MTGRLADLFRLAWGLLYWNLRKSWFQVRRGRSPCPCQSASDSGRALETGCEACLHWAKPLRFRRVCPLLVETSNGLRCSADTPQVRPFWGRAFTFYAGLALALYFGAALSVFGFLRTVGYPISILHLVWPPSWHRVGQVRGSFFLNRAQQAFASNRPAEGMLYLSNAHELDPTNYAVGFTLAQKLQLSHPLRSDELYQTLVRDHAEQRPFTYQVWFRALLARGDFPGVAEIARRRLLEDRANASVWMRALVFAARQTGDTATLRQLRTSADAAVLPWYPLVVTELFLQEGRRGEALAQLRRGWAGIPPYGFYYQIDELINLGDGLRAVDLLEANRAQLDDTARAALRLHAYAALDATQPMQRFVGTLLEPALTPPVVNLLAANLIRHPDPATLDRLLTKFSRQEVPLADATLESYLALYCATAATAEWERLQQIGDMMRHQLGSEPVMLGVAETFFRERNAQSRIARLLPFLPMSLEVHYALLERYPGERRPPP